MKKRIRAQFRPVEQEVEKNNNAVPMRVRCPLCSGSARLVAAWGVYISHAEFAEYTYKCDRCGNAWTCKE